MHNHLIILTPSPLTPFRLFLVSIGRVAPCTDNGRHDRSSEIL